MNLRDHNFKFKMNTTFKMINNFSILIKAKAFIVLTICFSIDLFIYFI
jgi:hypothetical protein